MPTPPTPTPPKTLSRDRLYNLLPAIYRIRDGAEGEPLRALLAAVEQEAEILEGNIADLYDDWFIETCAEWVVPYIGDLLDVRELYADRTAAYGQQERRAYIANTLAYRRRKGTAPILEQLTRDVTGWRSRVVEFSRLVNTTQHLDHPRPTSTTVSLRADRQPQEVGTPFETQAAYSVEIRPASQGGRYNTPNMGLFIWRLQSYPLERSTACVVFPAETSLPPPPAGSFLDLCGDDPPPPERRYYTFSPRGVDEPLFNQPQTETNIVTLAEEINLPVRLRGASLALEIAARQQGRSHGQIPTGIRYFDSDPVLQLFVNRQSRPIPPEEILIRSLEPWPKPEDLQNELTTDQPEASVPLPVPTVAVDPERGRIAFLGQTVPQHLEVSYFYGFSDDVGGGSYGRAEAPDIAPPPTDQDQTQIQIPPLDWTVQQARTADPNPLATAIQTWNQTVVAWDGLERGTHLPLARLVLPAVHLVQVDRERVRPKFAPGIVGEGLSVRLGLCPTEVLVTAGVAVDGQGRSLIISEFQHFDLRQVALDTLPNGIGLLVVAHDPLAANATRLSVIPEATLEGYPEATFIPLARLCLDAHHRLLGSPDLRVRPQLQPGIVQGLEVQTRPGTLETYLTAGTGVDAQGRGVVLTQNQPVAVRPHQGQVRSLILGIPSRFGGSWRLDLLPPSELETLDYPFLHLANLDIPTVRIQAIDTHIRPTAAFQIQGFDLSPQNARLTIAPGSITPITPPTAAPVVQLEREQRLDLSAYAGRTLVLFLAIARHPGLPLDFEVKPSGRGWRNLGIVPEQPPDFPDGRIVIGDSATYGGDLTILLPARQRLTIVAANGYRPTVQGSMTVQGMAIAEEIDRRQGELKLDGLLLDGCLSVAAGNLGRLTLQHCTLVPQRGGLSVEAPEATESDGPPPPQDDDSELTYLAFLFYALNQIWLLILRELGIRRGQPSLTLAEVIQRIVEQIVALVTELLRQLLSWLNGEACPQDDAPTTPGRQENSRLELAFYRTISGAIALPDPVPSLRLEDCIIDKGFPLGDSDATSGVAIAAPGTTAEVLTTTVLGRTQLRQLEASNSLFTEKVTVLRHQEGCLRFCYLPVGSQTPRRYQCQPDRALQEALEQIPAPVSTLFLADVLSGTLVIGTAGDGVFQYGRLSASSAGSASFEEGLPGWIDGNANLRDRHITALLAYNRLLTAPTTAIPAARTSVPHRPILLAGTLSGQVFQALPEAVARAEAADGGASQQTWRIPDWVPLPLQAGNAAITALLAVERSGMGTVTVNGTIVQGQDTAFPLEVQVGDWIRIDRQLRRVAALGIPGTGKLTTQGRQVTLTDGKGLTLKEGDTLTAQGQTRTITALLPPDRQAAEDSLRLEINRPFNSDLQTAGSFTVNLNTHLVVDEPFEESESQSGEFLPFSVPGLWAATAGGGVWQGDWDGRVWRSRSTGLTNSNISALLWDEGQNQFWAGTKGDGVFVFQRQRVDGEWGDRWMPQNQGLEQGGDRTITQLIQDRKISDLFVQGDSIQEDSIQGDSIQEASTSGQLLAATLGGGVFAWDETHGWIPLNEGLTSLDITTLVAFQTSRPSSSESPADQERIWMAGSADGKLFQTRPDAPEGAIRWQSPILDLKGTDITALVVGAAVNGSPPTLFAGTAAGEVLRSSDGGQEWRSILAGRPGLAQTLQILNRLQPSFTSTCYGDPGYAQLQQNCAPEIRTGAEDGAEMGVFNSLQQPQREANLRTSLEDHLRFGLSAGIFYVT
ncbi:MAG: hypothetical protein VKK04_17575 [Synechococcales bacterium]|nr:hypothetical protein [Synechococcales bacterium]